MPTEKQINANRRNARHSTGPRTEEGKKQSRLNAFKHGLTGQLDIMTDELREAHDTFITRIVLSLKPERTARGALCALDSNAIEDQLAHSIAESYWRMNRIATIENALFAEGDYVQFEHNQDQEYSDLARALSSARAFIEHPERFNLLTVYEMRLHRKAQADLKQLRQLQAERRAQEAEEAKAARREQPATKTTPAAPPASPAPVMQSAESAAAGHENGFVFSDLALASTLAQSPACDPSPGASVS